MAILSFKALVTTFDAHSTHHLSWQLLLKIPHLQMFPDKQIFDPS